MLNHVVDLFFIFFMSPPFCSPYWLHQFTFPSAVLEGSHFCTPSGAFVIFTDDGHSDLCEMIPRYGLDLHFCDN